jgi:FtsZ-binding cell division protein ZapB
MQDIEQRLKTIQEKLQQLLKQQALLQKENAALKEQLNSTVKEKQQYAKTADELKQQLEIVKITSGSWDENDKKEFEKRINGFVKEIDRCIALLGE